jgi:hypothetical protein
MKLVKELSVALFLAMVLLGTYSLVPFLDIPPKKTAQIPVFQNQDFCFSVLPLQIFQSWILEQQLESKDVTVQEKIRQLVQQMKSKQNPVLEDFTFDVHGAVAFYQLEEPQNPFSCIYLAGHGQQKGWLNEQYYGIESGMFFIPEKLSIAQQNYFEKSIQQMRLQNKTFQARQHLFELKDQTYKLLWEEHAFSLILPPKADESIRKLVPNGFHISTPVALSNLGPSFRFLETVHACSINYYGALLNDEQALVLDFETLLTFKNAKARANFVKECKQNFANWQWAPNFVRVNDAIYAIKEEGQNQLYICSKPKEYIKNGVIKTQSNTFPIVCAGEPTLLTKLDNAGWAAAILELFPIYRGISDFSARTAHVSTVGNTIKWELKKDYFAAGEFLKLISSALE